MIELMVVVAIAAIIVGLSVAAYSGIGARSAPQNAAHDFYSALTRARSVAAERGSDVWVIIFPNINLAGADGGGGAYFVYEDADINFTSAGTRKLSNFVPPSAVAAGAPDRLISSVYLDSYQRQNARFFASSGVAYGAPFTALSSAVACTFCSGTAAEAKGAIVFSADGSARFVDGDGNTTAARTAGVALRARETTQSFLFAVSSATSFVTTFQ